MSVPVVLLALSAACCMGFGFVLQQQAAQQAPLKDFLSPRLLVDLAKVPRWLAGLALVIAGMPLGALALAMGDLSLVEPLLATNLLFALTLSQRRTRQPLGRQGWWGLVLLAGGVTAFLLAGQPRQGSRITDPVRHWLILGVLAGLALFLTALAKRSRLVVTPVLLGTAAGLLYGMQDALTRMSGLLFSDGGLVGLLSSWEPYGVVLFALSGMLLVQSAFETAPLRMSLPAVTAAEPLAGIACGVGFLGDQLRTTPAALAGQVTGLVAVVTGIFLLGMHPAMPRGASAHTRAKDLMTP